MQFKKEIGNKPKASFWQNMCSHNFVWAWRFRGLFVTKSTFLLVLFIIPWSSYKAFSQTNSSNWGRQENLYKKNYFSMTLNFGAGMANRVCVPCYEDEVIFGTTFDAAAGFVIADRWKIKLETGGFYEKWQLFHDDSSEESDHYNNNRNYFVGSISYYPFRFPLWIGCGAGIGNYDFTPEKPILTQQGTYTLSTIFNSGFLIQGGIGFDYLFAKKIISGIKIFPSYLFLDDLEFVTGEKLSNHTGSFVLGVSLSFGINLNLKTSTAIQEINK